MPYPNEHAARLVDPSEFKEFRRQHPKGFPEGLDVIFGIREDGKTEIQAVRADRTKWTVEGFKKWLADHDMSPILLEPASDSTKKGFDTFSTWTAIDLDKGVNGEGEEAVSPKAYIAGVISSDAVDLQGDKIVQEGMDWSYFLKRGWLNWEHQQGPENIVGVPTSVEPVTLAGGKKAAYLKGYLLLNRPKAKEIMETAKALSSAGSDRKIGFSVEGQVLARDPQNPKVITKARILNVSVTAHPVNPDANTLELIARSMDSANSARAVAEHILKMHPEVARKEVLMELLNLIDGKKEYKSEVGYQTGATPSSGSLSALVPQSIDEELSYAKGLDMEGIKEKLQAASISLELEVEDDSMDDSEDGEDGEDSMDESEAEQPNSIIDSTLREAMKIELQKLMEEQLGKFMDAASGKATERALISQKQIATLVDKVFPSLPASAKNLFVNKLISAARSSYSKNN